MNEYHLKKTKQIIIKSLIDGLLLFVAFAIIYYAKYGHLNIQSVYFKFLPVYFFSSIISNFLSGKYFFSGANKRHLLQLKPFIVSATILSGLLSLILYAFKWYELSRIIVYGSVGIYFLLQVLFLSNIYYDIVKLREVTKKNLFSFFFFLFEFILIISCFLALHLYKRGHFNVNDQYIILLSIIYFLWIFTGLIIHKFKIPETNNYLKTIWPFIKSSFIILCFVSFFVFGLRVIEYSRFLIFGSILLFSIFEFFFVSVVYIYTKKNKSDEVEVDFFKAQIISEEMVIQKVVNNGNGNREKYKIPGEDIKSNYLHDKLKSIYLLNQPEIFKFIDNNLKISAVDIVKSEVISSGNPYNVKILPDNSLQMFMNLHELNDYRRMNRYLIEVNRILKDGGVFISKFEPKEKRRIHFLNKYPFYLANVLYFIDFVWKRCFPKLPFFQKIYFAASKGRNRVLSMTEGLGRLYFCGFEIIGMEEIDNFIYFMVKKTNSHSLDPNPSYSPVFKMKRVGQYGKPIYIYKFRTMFPYSEYLQNFVTEKFGYGEKGKIKDDFRVTTWGKFLRRFWLDESPQLLNFIKGDLALVAMRPVSERFLENYPEDIRKERLKYKPGCLPPYVAYKMQNVEDYIESERIYLAEKKKHPFLTDVKVFFLVIYNILTNKIRSE